MNFCRPARWFSQCFKSAFSFWCGDARSTAALCGLLPPSAPTHRKITWNITMKSDGAGDFPVCYQTDFLLSSSSALQSQDQPMKGRGRKLEGGRRREIWVSSPLWFSGSCYLRHQCFQLPNSLSFWGPSFPQAGLLGSSFSVMPPASGTWHSLFLSLSLYL